MHNRAWLVGNRWTGILNGMMEWDSERTQLQLTHVTGVAQSFMVELSPVSHHSPVLPAYFYVHAW